MIDDRDRDDAGNAAGQVFGYLTLIRPTGELIRGVTVYECRCECGNFDKATIPLLKMGRKTSCGCRNRTRLEAAKPDLPEVDRLRAFVAADGRSAGLIAEAAGLTESIVAEGLASGRKLTLAATHSLLKALGKGWADLDDPAVPSRSEPSRTRAVTEAAGTRSPLPQPEWGVLPNGTRPRHLTSILSRNRFQVPAWFQADLCWMSPITDGEGRVFGGDSI